MSRNSSAEKGVAGVESVCANWITGSERRYASAKSAKESSGRYQRVARRATRKKKEQESDKKGVSSRKQHTKSKTEVRDRKVERCDVAQVLGSYKSGAATACGSSNSRSLRFKTEGAGNRFY